MTGRGMKQAALAVVVLATLGLSGCGSDDDTAAVCDSADTLKDSVDQLKSVEVSPGGVDQLQTDFAQVKTDFAQFKSDAKDEFGPEIEAFQSSIDQVGAALDLVAGQPSAATIGPLLTSLNGVPTSFQALQEAVAGTC